MKKTLLFLAVLLVAGTVSAEQSATTTILERYSYTMGVKLGQLLKQQGVTTLDSAALAAAIDDVLGGGALRYTEDEMGQAVLSQQRLLAEQRATLARENQARGEAFLAGNASQPDVVVLPSGLQYRVLKVGEGAQPGAQDRVRVHYRGTLIDGTEFDSSYGRGEPTEFALDRVIRGFSEAISLMHVGDRWQVFVPGQLAYGERGAGANIGPNETLIFEIELLDIVR